MLKQQDLIENFSEVTNLGDRVFRCKDTTPRSTYYYYVKSTILANGEVIDLLVVSENLADDAFARLIFINANSQSFPTGLKSLTLPANKYSFTNLILAPENYHAYFKGALDNKRQALILCLPVYQCEFSGNELPEEFSLMRRSVVTSLNWERSMFPKIVLYFDNPKTLSGTGGSQVLAKYDLLLREVDNLNGVSNGFIEITNYKDHVVEILSPETQEFVFIRNRNDGSRESLTKDLLLVKLWAFLTEDM